MPVTELLVCWYCPREFKNMTDAWGHMDTDHPAEAAEDLRRMDNDVRARRHPNGKAALAFLDQNALAARTLKVDQIAPYAQHHAGNLYVLIGVAADSATIPVDGATATCGRCHRSILWDRDDAESPYGFWYDADHDTEVCIPGPNDEDHYHRPATDTGKFVKLHDSWGDEGKVIVHEYDPDNPTDDEPMWEFDTGADALKKFIERISES